MIWLVGLGYYVLVGDCVLFLMFYGVFLVGEVVLLEVGFVYVLFEGLFEGML